MIDGACRSVAPTEAAKHTSHNEPLAALVAESRVVIEQAEAEQEARVRAAAEEEKATTTSDRRRRQAQHMTVT